MMTTHQLADANAGLLARAAQREQWALLGLTMPAFVLVFLVMLLPVLWLFGLSFLNDEGQFSLENYQRLVESKSYARIFRTTFEVSILTTLICALLGYPLAYLFSQLPSKKANLLMIAVLLPFWTSLLVRTYAWLVLLQRRGVINDWGMSLGFWEEPLKLVHNLSGTLIGMVHIMLPLMILPLYGGMKTISADYTRAAANLGAGPVRVFTTVFLPLSLPGLLAGAMIVFVLCLGFFVTPSLLGGGRVIMLSMRIQTDIELFYNWGAASALGVVLLIFTLLIFYLSMRFLRMKQWMESN